MSRSERHLPRRARGPGPVPRRARHASPLTGFRRWRNRHEGPSRRRRRRRGLTARRLTRLTGWALLLAGSILVYLLAWQLIGDDVSADSLDRPPAQQVSHGNLKTPAGVVTPAGAPE